MVIPYEMGWLLNCVTVMIPIKTKLLHDDENNFFLDNDKFRESLHKYCMSGMYLGNAELMGLKLKCSDRCGPPMFSI